jgi:hypothetical protein
VSGRIPDEAFERYVALGDERSYQRVAEEYGVSKRAVTKHAQRARWAERLAEIERAARVKSDQRMVETLSEMRDRHLKTLRVMNARVLAAIKEHPLESGMDAIRAGEIVIKLERLIAGEPTERTASIEEVMRREMDMLLVVEDDDEDDDDGSTGEGEADGGACGEAHGAA